MGGERSAARAARRAERAVFEIGVGLAGEGCAAEIMSLIDDEEGFAIADPGVEGVLGFRVGANEGKELVMIQDADGGADGGEDAEHLMEDDFVAADAGGTLMGT